APAPVPTLSLFSSNSSTLMTSMSPILGSARLPVNVCFTTSAVTWMRFDLDSPPGSRSGPGQEPRVSRGVSWAFLLFEGLYGWGVTSYAQGLSIAMSLLRAMLYDGLFAL